MYEKYQRELSENGFTVIENIFSDEATNEIINKIEAADKNNPLFRKTADLFAIRRFFHAIPEVQSLVFNSSLKEVINLLFGDDYFVVKSIYFDKPGNSNWFVAWHQDLTISVAQKADVPGYGPWTVKPGQYAVQPPADVLENIYTIRIHLDDTTIENGALKVIPGSHAMGVIRPETIDLKATPDVSCSVNKGGIMIMQPLLLHASSRSTNNQNRRVIHIEFSNLRLPEALSWAETE